jgi:hypothetical protein
MANNGYRIFRLDGDLYGLSIHELQESTLPRGNARAMGCDIGFSIYSGGI